MTSRSIKSNIQASFLALCISSAAWLTVGCNTSGPATPPTSASSPVPAPVNPQFKILSPKPNTTLDVNITTTISGTHNLSPKDKVWIFLTDTFGGYYVQNPRTTILNDGTWETAIRPGQGINYIIAIYVNSEGDKVIQGWVDNGRFGKIEAEEVQALPGYLELDRVKIKTPGS